MRPARRVCCESLFAIGIGSVLLPGCTTPSPSRDATDTTTRQWQGRFSVTLLNGTAGTGTVDPEEERAQGRFTLVKSPRSLELALFSPFGQTLVNASSTPAGATLTTSDGQVYRAGDTDSLIEKALGWRLPVSALPDWLSGTTLAPGTETVDQDNWRVQVEQRFDNGLPRRLAARWPLEQRVHERRINLFLVVDQPS